MAEFKDLPTNSISYHEPPAARGKFFLYGVFILLSLTVIWLARQPHVQATFIDWNNYSLWENVKRLTSSEDKALLGENDGRINFLLLGQGGPGHDGPYLTDTIMLASLDTKHKNVGLLSLPRDLVVNIPGFGARKINNANAFGELKGNGLGPLLAKETISQLLDQPIHYYVRLDFSSFVSLVDDLGGLPINIEQSFTDSQYPGPNYSFTVVNFETGQQTLSGEKTLQYVRSRHGSNQQGSDFSRAKRQQQVLLALKDQLLSAKTLFNPRKILHLYQDISQGLLTDITAQETVRLANLLSGLKTQNIRHRIIDTSPGGLLKEATGGDGAYLLLPKTADYSDIKKLAADLLANSGPLAENPYLIIENGTTIPGLAESVTQTLKNKGLTNIIFGNANRRDFPRTILYDYSGGQKPDSRQLLESFFGLNAVTLEPVTTNSEQADFRLILGRDRAPN
ncbi:LCP family protein [Patescibacteria group bacterium]|nr:LCP family protein [Patescibacteria group bacterium]